MAKLTAIVVTILGILLTLSALDIYTIPYQESIVAIGVLVVGVGKLIRNFSK